MMQMWRFAISIQEEQERRFYDPMLRSRDKKSFATSVFVGALMLKTVILPNPKRRSIM